MRSSEIYGTDEPWCALKNCFSTVKFIYIYHDCYRVTQIISAFDRPQIPESMVNIFQRFIIFLIINRSGCQADFLCS